jgi:hypothetical protein
LFSCHAVSPEVDVCFAFFCEGVIGFCGGISTVVFWKFLSKRMNFTPQVSFIVAFAASIMIGLMLCFILATLNHVPQAVCGNLKVGHFFENGSRKVGHFARLF